MRPYSLSFLPLVAKSVSLLLSAKGFPGGSDGKESACNAGDLGLTPGLGRSPGESNGLPSTHSSILVWRIPWTEQSGGP